MQRSRKQSESDRAGESSGETREQHEQSSTEPSPLSSLHGSVGNQSIQRQIEGGVIDPPDSPAEREAERVARQVLGSPPGSATGPSGVAGGVTIERRPSAGHKLRAGEVGEGDGAKPTAGHEDGRQVADNVEQRIGRKRGTGTPLPDAERSYFEPRFGHSFGDVTVHHDAEANSLADMLNAEAFTTGTDVFFSRGSYQPGTSEGRSLLAHELTHVVQQRGSRATAARMIQRESPAAGKKRLTATTDDAGVIERKGPEPFDLTMLKDQPKELTQPITENFGSFTIRTETYGELLKLIKSVRSYVARTIDSGMTDEQTSKVNELRKDLRKLENETQTLVDIGTDTESGLDPEGEVDPNAYQATRLRTLLTTKLAQYQFNFLDDLQGTGQEMGKQNKKNLTGKTQKNQTLSAESMDMLERIDTFLSQQAQVFVNLVGTAPWVNLAMSTPLETLAGMVGGGSLSPLPGNYAEAVKSAREIVGGKVQNMIARFYLKNQNSLSQKEIEFWRGMRDNVWSP
jgi:hypothetical protein